MSTILEIPDARVTLYPNFFNSEEATRIYHQLLNETQWIQHEINLFGKKIQIPRETAWHGDSGMRYTYSGMTLEPQPWNSPLIYIKQRIETEVQTSFNSVLLNHYRNENDSVGWHSDDEPELGKNPTIASLSLGATRKFQFQHKSENLRSINIQLTNGSLLLMSGTTQKFWKHRIPKSAVPTGSRINLTFRMIVQER